MMMLKILIVLGILIANTYAAFLQCDFESPCNDFNTDNNWGLTDGLHPKGIVYDHTLNTSAGHYLFYNPQIPPPPFRQFIGKIKSNRWIELPTITTTTSTTITTTITTTKNTICSKTRIIYSFWLIYHRLVFSLQSLRRSYRRSTGEVKRFDPILAESCDQIQ